MKIVLDTSILIAAFLKDGVCRRVLMECLQKHRLFLSEEVLIEFLQMSREPFFAAHKKQLEFFLEMLAESSDIKNPPIASLKCFRKNDQKYVDLALAAEAHMLVTTSADLIEENTLHSTLVVSPKQFLSEENTFKKAA